MEMGKAVSQGAIGGVLDSSIAAEEGNRTKKLHSCFGLLTGKSHLSLEVHAFCVIDLPKSLTIG
jgi:hypothetical protein